MAEKGRNLEKLLELAKSVEDSNFLQEKARMNKQERRYRDIFYASTSADSITNDIQTVIKNCDVETKKQLQEFLQKYQGKAEQRLSIEDIMEYIGTMEIYLGDE